MSTPTEFSAILFDLDGTLVDHESAARAGVEQWSTELGLPAGQWPRWAEIERRWFTRFERRQISHLGQRIERAREFLNSPDLTEDEALLLYERYLDLYRENWRAYPDALPALQAALDTGAAVGILTNGENSMQTDKLARTGLLLDDLVVLAATDLQAAKPQPEAYHASLRRLRVQAAEAVLIGDNWANDVDGARRVGMSGVYLLRRGCVRDGACPPEEASISTLDQLRF